jgi:hypothetical protein
MYGSWCRRSESHVKFVSTTLQEPSPDFDDHAPPQTLSCCRVQLIETRHATFVFCTMYLKGNNQSLQSNIEEPRFFNSAQYVNIYFPSHQRLRMLAMFWYLTP